MVPTTETKQTELYKQTNDDDNSAASSGRRGVARTAMAAGTLTIIKASLGNDTRRFNVNASVSWAELQTKLATVFNLAAPPCNPPTWRTTWVDEDGDHITVQTEADWQECVRHVHGLNAAGAAVVLTQQRTVIRLHVAVQAAPPATLPVLLTGAAALPQPPPSTLPPAPMSPGWQQHAAEKGPRFSSQELADVETLEMMAEAMETMERVENAPAAARATEQEQQAQATELQERQAQQLAAWPLRPSLPGILPL